VVVSHALALSRSFRFLCLDCATPPFLPGPALLTDSRVQFPHHGCNIDRLGCNVSVAQFRSEYQDRRPVILVCYAIWLLLFFFPLRAWCVTQRNAERCLSSLHVSLFFYVEVCSWFVVRTPLRTPYLFSSSMLLSVSLSVYSTHTNTNTHEPSYATHTYAHTHTHTHTHTHMRHNNTTYALFPIQQRQQRHAFTTNEPFWS
jgi:hypothetical protein